LDEARAADLDEASLTSLFFRFSSVGVWLLKRAQSLSPKQHNLNECIAHPILCVRVSVSNNPEHLIGSRVVIYQRAAHLIKSPPRHRLIDSPVGNRVIPHDECG